MTTVLLIAFIAAPLLWIGCDRLTLNNPKIAELETKVVKLEEQILNWRAANIRLQNERQAALDRVTELEKENTCR